MGMGTKAEIKRTLTTKKTLTLKDAGGRGSESRTPSPSVGSHASFSEDARKSMARQKTLAKASGTQMLLDMGLDDHDSEDSESRSSASNHRSCADGQHRLVNRLYQQVTNPKVTRDEGRGDGQTKESKVPNHIE